MRKWLDAVLVAASVCLLGIAVISCGAKDAAPGESCDDSEDCRGDSQCVAGRCSSETVPVAEGTPSSAAKASSASSSAPRKVPTWEVFRVSSDVKDPFLNVREDRRTKSKLLAKLPEGGKVYVVMTKGKWRRIRVLAGEHRGLEGWVHICCLRPTGSDDFYRAMLSEDDHHNSSGTALGTSYGIVSQDRANYHVFDVRDPGDRPDLTFHDKSKRAWLSKMAKKAIDKKTARIIRKRMPTIDVTVWPDRVDIEIVKRGEEL